MFNYGALRAFRLTGVSFSSSEHPSLPPSLYWPFAQEFFNPFQPFLDVDQLVQNLLKRPILFRTRATSFKTLITSARA